MLSRLLRREAPLYIRQTRTIATGTAAIGKKAGDISDAFTQLSGKQFEPLEPRFAQLKHRLISGHEDAVQASWMRLLDVLRAEIPLLASLGSKCIPEIDFTDLDKQPAHFHTEVKKRGVAVVRNVVAEAEALQFKADIRAYIAANPHTRAFPAANPQVFELYWSPSQIRARAHPNLLKTQQILMQAWHSANQAAPLSTAHPTSYADRLRIRLPGDASFALGPHMDGGSVERWEEEGYGRGSVYKSIFAGRWEEYDPWEASCRLDVQSDLYAGQGACSMFRMYQGWLSMSHTAAHEGTLLVNPLLAATTAYVLMRPFFVATNPDPSSPDYLSASNWRLTDPADSWLQGATPGKGQELTPALHPHLDLARSMVHIPTVRPGDYVVWHCDTTHAVDARHAGTSDSSVLYIPACPLTPHNAAYIARQRAAFVAGHPGPDFPGGEGEAHHVGRPGVAETAASITADGRRAMGLEGWDGEADGLTSAQREAMHRANVMLGFY